MRNNLKEGLRSHVQYVYGCRDCEKNACAVPIIKAKADVPLIKGSIACSPIRRGAREQAR